MCKGHPCTCRSCTRTFLHVIGFAEWLQDSLMSLMISFSRRHQKCHFRKRATSAPAEGPAYGLDFTRPLRTLQAQKWYVCGSGRFCAAWLLHGCDTLVYWNFTAISPTILNNKSLILETTQSFTPLAIYDLKQSMFVVLKL